MGKNQTSQETTCGVRSEGNRQLLWARVFLMASLLAFSLIVLQPGPPVQAGNQPLRGENVGRPSIQTSGFATDCTHCERAYVECLAAGGDVFCEIQYDACLEACLEGGTFSLQKGIHSD